MSSSDSTIIGIVLLARHGDRNEHWQDPYTYTTTLTTITPLGEQQEWQLGNYLRSIYLNGSSPSYIQGIAPYTSLFNGTQVEVYADNVPDDAVIMDSCAALVQGLWHATTDSNITLANGTTIIGPLGGYQYVPINAVDPSLDVSLEGSTGCNAFNSHTLQVYNSTLFKAKEQEAAPFLAELPPYVDGRNVSLTNMWNIYDYIDVQDIHNATYAENLPPTFLEQARDLANWQQYQVFTDPSFGGIGNIAFQTMLPGIIDSFNRIANSSDTLRLSYYAISYKPFLSLFNMTGVVEEGVLPAALVNYAASAIFEVRQSSPDSEPVIRFQFKNGTADTSYSAYPLVFPGWNGTESGTDIPLSTFAAAFEPVAINTTSEWCSTCGTTGRITPVDAGFLGAGLTAAAFLLTLSVLMFLGVLTLGVRRFKKTPVTRIVEKGEMMHGDKVELRF